MIVIRRYQPTDRGDVDRVCVMTSTSGRDATGLHADDNVIPDIFAGSYRAIEPELAFVVDTGEWMAGYVIATGNTRLFARHYREASARRAALGTTPANRMIDLGYRPERMNIAMIDKIPRSPAHRSTAWMGIVEHVDPNTSVVEATVRTESQLLREFAASIKQNEA
ncbi:hypothetical protein [Cryobacterium sp. Y62]|uniref:hypothetical protein n=1 Tax=Cryobacterium sp. Y62 TaxID=2048284 RepID=UPI000CE34AD7|nr:hypothetical protein [Cryobacterium sp. Y62]